MEEAFSATLTAEESTNDSDNEKWTHTPRKLEGPSEMFSNSDLKYLRNHSLFTIDEEEVSLERAEPWQ